VKATYIFLFLSALLLASSAAPALGDTILVANPSFEMTNPLTTGCGAGCAFNLGPIPDWTETGFQGSWQPSSAFFTAGAPDGNIVAYSNGGTISQILGASLLANTTYTLSVDVGHRLDGLVNNYAIALFAGGTLLNALPGSNGVIPIGTFADESLSYTSGGVNLPSGNLMIVLASAGSQVDFDNVRLSAAPVPEPGTLALLATGLGLVFLVLRRR
jgi:hypothetical protein